MGAPEPKPAYSLARVNSRWHAVWYDAAGHRKRRSLGTDDRALAQARLGEFVRHLSFSREAKAPLTVAAIFAAYLEDRAAEAKVAVPRMKDAWKRLEPCFGSLPPHHVNKDLCRAFMAGRRKQGAGDGTIHVELGYLRAALRFARKSEWITTEPVVILPRKPPPKEHHLTPEEARALVDAAGLPHVRLFILLALFTAGRATAILDLTWDRVDLKSRIIRLHDPATGTTTKGRATVPIGETLAQALDEAKTGAVGRFVVEWGGSHVGSVKKGVAAAARRAGIACSPHVLRHTAAVWMAGAGVDMARIAQYMGHRDSRTTERIYARFSPAYLRDAAAALDTQFSLVDDRPALENAKATQAITTPIRAAKTK